MTTDETRERGRRRPEWLEFGDPRCAEGHFRPKNNLGAWLKITKSWSQKRLADKMNTDEATVSKWICGKLYLTDRKLVRVARVTGLSIPYLLDMQHQGNPSDDGMALDALDYTELDYDDDDAFDTWGEDSYEHNKPEWVWGTDYGPHETQGFASELLEERETLWSERWRSERRGLPSRDDNYEEFAKALDKHWDPEENYTVYTYLHFIGDIRDPWHLETELHKELMRLRPSRRALVLDSLVDIMRDCAGAMTRSESLETQRGPE